MIVLLFCFALNMQAASGVVDVPLFEWKFGKGSNLRDEDLALPDNHGGAIQFTGRHLADGGSVAIEGRFGAFSIHMNYASSPVYLSTTHLEFFVSSKKITHSYIMSYAPFLRSSSGYVTLTLPGESASEWLPEICPMKSRPSQPTWMCWGDGKGMEYRQFLFHSAGGKQVCIGAKVVFADLPKVVVSYGYADSDGFYTCAPQRRIFDLGFDSGAALEII